MGRGTNDVLDILMKTGLVVFFLRVTEVQLQVGENLNKINGEMVDLWWIYVMYHSSI